MALLIAASPIAYDRRAGHQHHRDLLEDDEAELLIEALKLLAIE
jgi:hypothetical protein